MNRNNICLLLFCAVLFISCKDNLVDNNIETEGGICLTFDDTYVNEWYNISNELVENEIKATFFVTMINKFSHSKLRKLQSLDSLGFEIGCHGYKHLNAKKYLETHSMKEYYDNEILPSLTIMEQIGFTPTSFSYPQGMNNDSLDNFMLNYFDILRDVTDEQRKPLKKNVEDIDEIYCKKGRSNVISSLGIDICFNIDEQMLRAALERVKNNNEVLCVYAHCPVDSNACNYQVNVDYIKNFISMIKEFELKTFTISELAK